MALSFTDQYCIADPLTESTSGMLAFPWIARTADGALVMAYHDGVDGPGGVTRLKASRDRGVTWTAGQVVWDEGLGTGAQIAVLSSGDWLLTSQGYVSGSPSGVYSRRSADQGATWSTTQFVAPGLWTSSAAVELASGTLLFPVYAPQAGRDVSQMLASTDDGATWSATGTVMALPGSVGAGEATLQQMPNGSVVALVRCADYMLRRTVSCDDGATWSAPVAVLSGVASRVDWVKLASGRCVAAWRDSVTGCAMAGWSADDMVTVTGVVQIHGPDKRTSYSALTEVAPGQVFAAIGEIDDGETTGRIMARYLLDGDGMAPTGQTTHLDAIARACGAGNIVAWDSFNRPDNAHGLGSADSGQQYQEYGGGSDWHLSGGAATNVGVAGRYHSVTLAVGLSNGFVEADLMWSGSTSSPLGLCALRSTVSGHALVGKLDAGGGTARISYWNGAAISADLGSVSVLHYPAGVWYRVRLGVKGGVARLFIDGHEVVSYVLTSTDQANLDGTRWGLWGGGSSGVTYKAKNLIISQ